MIEQNPKLHESANQIPIRSFLSYRHGISENADAIELLRSQCAEKNIALIYDEVAINTGASIKKFMDELASARCIFLFLTPTYFQSAYTLYELVTILEWADFDKRFIYPIRVTEDMTVYQLTTTETYWKENQAIRDELTRLLQLTDHETAWQRVKAAWDNIIFPFLDKLHPSLERGDKNDILSERVQATRSAIITVIEEEKNILRSKIKSEITKILKNNFIPLGKLAQEIGLETGISVEDFAKYLSEKDEINDILNKLINVLEEQRDRLMPSKPEQWDNCYFDAERLCGWLMINSVDAVWWFNHQLKMQQAVRKNASRTYSLTHPPYVEVIISRSVIRNAQYKLDKKGRVQPNSGKHNIALFDSISIDATDTQLLAPIYKDLLDSTEYPEKLEELIDAIKIRARNLYEKNGKPVYYLMEQTTMKLIENRPWFKEGQQELARHLQFICCNLASAANDPSPCGDQKSLLDKLAMLLSMK